VGQNSMQISGVSGSILDATQHIQTVDSLSRRLFENPENIDGFMRLPNHNPPFNGCTPLEMIEHGSEKYQRRVIEHLNGVGNIW
jgi:hypothetical protein